MKNTKRDKEFFPAASARDALGGAEHSQGDRLRSLFGGVLFAGDLAIWLVSFAGAFLLISLCGSISALPNLSIVAWPFAVIAIVLTAIGGYDRRSDMMSLEFTSLYLVALVVGATLSILLVYLFGTYKASLQPSRALVPVAVSFFTLLSLLGRRLFVRMTTPPGALSDRFLVVASETKRAEFLASFEKEETDPLFQFLNPTEAEAADENGTPDWLSRFKSDGRLEGVIIADEIAQLPINLTASLVAIHFKRMPVYTAETFFEDHCRRVYLPHVTPEWLFHDKFLLTRKSVFCHVKRALDVCAAIAGLVVLAPFLLLVGSIIRLESEGPAIFRQVRIGRDGQPFLLYKLRTMRQAVAGDRYTQEGDARITRSGRWLRKSRLDELPQLWNVVRGDMSLIGPRAEWIECTEVYENEISNYHLRHLVRPGITGWAQVNHPYGESLNDAVQKLSYDLYYIRYFSLLLDWSIVLKTVYVMVFGKGR